MIDEVLFEDEGVANLSLNSKIPSPNFSTAVKSRDSEIESKNIYETLEFRESPEMHIEENDLPDILRHTRTRIRRTSDESYESVICCEVRQVYYIFNSLICTF